MSRRVRLTVLLAAIGYGLAVHIFLLVLVLKTNFLLLAGKTLGWIPPEEWNATLYSMILQQAEQDNRTPGSRVILLGDSLVAELDAPTIGQDAVNFGIGGDTTQTLLARIPVLRSLERSRVVVMAVGVNDLKYRPVTEITSDYARLLDRLAGVPRILVVSVLPVDEAGEAAKRRPYLRNQTIQALNDNLRGLCSARDNCRYIDAWPVLRAAGSTASGTGLYDRDGWHLSAAGSRVLSAFIRDSLPLP